MDNFDLKKYLVENKVTRNSKLLNEVDGIRGNQELLPNVNWKGLAISVLGFENPQVEELSLTISPVKGDVDIVYRLFLKEQGKSYMLQVYGDKGEQALKFRVWGSEEFTTPEIKEKAAQVTKELAKGIQSSVEKVVGKMPDDQLNKLPVGSGYDLTRDQAKLGIQYLQKALTTSPKEF